MQKKQEVFNYRALTVEGNKYRFVSFVQPVNLLAADPRPAGPFNPLVVFTTQVDPITSAPLNLINANTGPFHIFLTTDNRPIVPHSYGINIINAVTLAPFQNAYFYPYQWRDATRVCRYDRTARQLRRIDSINNPTQMFQSLDTHFLYDEDFFKPAEYDNIITMPGNYNQAGCFQPTDLATNLNSNSVQINVPPAGTDFLITKVFNYFQIVD